MIRHRVPPMRALALLLVPVVLAFGCSDSGGGGDEDAATTTTEAPTHAVTVALVHRFEPYDDSGINRVAGVGTNCGVSGLTDSTASLAYMDPGTDADLRDADGEIVSTTSLQVGEVTEETTDNRFTCQWTLLFGDVPASDFYEVSVGDENLGTLTDEDTGVGRTATIDLATAG